MLDRIVAAHKRAAASDDRSLKKLAAAAEAAPETRPFRDALRLPNGLTVVAEIKRRSPSAGPLAPDLVASEMARAYEQGGAAALSVLTDAEFFGGSPDDLRAARAATTLPVLRKDFTVCEADVCDARIMGADAVLLIVAALTDDELGRFLELATGLAMAALVEVHTEQELERALKAQADLIGINSRNLSTFEVDLASAEALAPLIPDDVVKVAESGISGAEDAARLARCGYDAVLVGTSVVTAADPAASVRALLSNQH